MEVDISSMDVGVINGTAPNPVKLAEMCKQLGEVMGRPSWLPVPDFALKAVLGEGACVVRQDNLPPKLCIFSFSLSAQACRRSLMMKCLIWLEGIGRAESSSSKSQGVGLLVQVPIHQRCIKSQPYVSNVF